MLCARWNVGRFEIYGLLGRLRDAGNISRFSLSWVSEAFWNLAQEYMQDIQELKTLPAPLAG